MATGTIASRITGIARDIAMAAALGFYLVSDAYSLGNALPTIIYILVIGGALNAVFIPQLVRRICCSGHEQLCGMFVLCVPRSCRP